MRLRRKVDGLVFGDVRFFNLAVERICRGDGLPIRINTQLEQMFQQHNNNNTSVADYNTTNRTTPISSKLTQPDPIDEVVAPLRRCWQAAVGKFVTTEDHHSACMNTT